KSDREDLRALLNAGYRRGAEVLRCEAAGRTQVVKRYPAFGAKAFASIGKLPDTIDDRSIRIPLRRRTTREPVTRFRLREARREAEPITMMLATWAMDGIFGMHEARPEIPESLLENDRLADAWEPLFAIADEA